MTNSLVGKRLLLLSGILRQGDGWKSEYRQGDIETISGDKWSAWIGLGIRDDYRVGCGIITHCIQSGVEWDACEFNESLVREIIAMMCG